jgi:hypothetical protein
VERRGKEKNIIIWIWHRLGTKFEKSNEGVMTDINIKEQIKTIERATQAAVKSKGAAIKFLKESGIITPTSTPAVPKKKK